VPLDILERAHPFGGVSPKAAPVVETFKLEVKLGLLINSVKSPDLWNAEATKSHYGYCSVLFILKSYL
jgi:hypothetical protein